MIRKQCETSYLLKGKLVGENEDVQVFCQYIKKYKYSSMRIKNEKVKMMIESEKNSVGTANQMMEERVCCCE